MIQTSAKSDSVVQSQQKQRAKCSDTPKQTKKTTQFWVLYNPNANGHLREVVAYERQTAGVFYEEKFGYGYLVKRMYCMPSLLGYNMYILFLMLFHVVLRSSLQTLEEHTCPYVKQRSNRFFFRLLL